MSRGVIASLRDFVPIRPLTRTEAYRIAELQAIRFHEQLGIHDGPVPESAITGLPKVVVQRFSPLPVSGATEWANGAWMILLNGAEPAARQRFSLAHELKHIADHRFIHVLYERIPEADRHAFIESVCDYFAGCLLVPRPWLKRAWGNGIQRPADQVRLSQVGLGDRPSRCSRSSPGWALPAPLRTGTPGPYHRLAAALAT